jgi:hypothetical protein
MLSTSKPDCRTDTLVLISHVVVQYDALALLDGDRKKELTFLGVYLVA